MKVDKRKVYYRFHGSDYVHHVIYFQDDEGKILLLSPFNLYMKDKGASAIKTSERYAGNLCNFLNFILERYQKDGSKFWRNASEEDLKEWQQVQVKERDKNKETKPSDKTVFDNASLVHSVYNWLRNQSFPVSMNPETKDWHFDYRSESMLTQIRGQISGTSADRKSISTGLPSMGDSRKNSMMIMSKADRKALINAYNDPVFSACFMLALATGMREEGVCQMPYLGTGDNIHIRPYPEILAEFGSAKTFPFTVVEKGKKRTLEVNMKAWESICKSYLPHYFKRRKLLIAKYPEINPDHVFFINRLGNPVNPKMISDRTVIAKKNLKNFPWSFHSSRSWYATQYMINNLTKSEIKDRFYNAAVEDGLRRQIGHSDIKTTYKHYLKLAAVVMAVQDREIGSNTWKELEETAGALEEKVGT